MNLGPGYRYTHFIELILCAWWNERLISVWQLPLARCTWKNAWEKRNGTNRTACMLTQQNLRLIVLSGRKRTAFHVWTRHGPCLFLDHRLAIVIDDDSHFYFDRLCCNTHVRGKLGKMEDNRFTSIGFVASSRWQLATILAQIILGVTFSPLVTTHPFHCEARTFSYLRCAEFPVF